MYYSFALLSYCIILRSISMHQLKKRWKNNIYQLIQYHRDFYHFQLIICSAYLLNIQTNTYLFQRSISVIYQKQHFEEMLIIMLWLWVDQNLQRQSSVDLTSLLLISTPLKSFNCPIWRRERGCCLPFTMSYTHRAPPHKDSTPSWVPLHNHNMNCLSSHPSTFVCNFVEANLNSFSFP